MLNKLWRKLTKNEPYTCLNGMPSGLSYEKIKGKKRYQKEKYWEWNKVKTREGCYSYFDGDC